MNSHVLFLIKGMSPSFCLPAMCVSLIYSSKWGVETHIFKSGFQSPLKLTAAHPAPSRPAIGSRDATVGRVWPLWIKRIRKTFSRHSNRDRYIPSQTSFKSLLGMSTTCSFFSLSTSDVGSQSLVCLASLRSSGWVDVCPEPSLHPQYL